MARTKKFNLPVDGGSISRDDLNLIAASAGSAEDNAISSLLVPPAWNGTVQRGVIPPRGMSLVTGNGVNSARVVAHTAFAGPLSSSVSTINTAFAANAVTNVASSTGTNTRYDLIYETIYVDVLDTPNFRKVKNRSSRSVSAAAFSNTSSCSTVIGIVRGVESATPTIPAIPADPVGGYNIPLAYIRIPTTYTGGSATIASGDIFEVAPVLTGPGIVRPAASFAAMPTSPAAGGRYALSGNANLLRFLPNVLAGSEQRMFGVSANTGLMADGTIIDDSIDWRNRLFRADAAAFNDTGESYAWYTPHGVPVAGTSIAGTNVVARVMGQSFSATFPTTGLANRVVAARLDSGLLSWASSNYVEINVDGSGRLVFHKSGDWNLTAFFWLEASAPYGNSY